MSGLIFYTYKDILVICYEMVGWLLQKMSSKPNKYPFITYCYDFTAEGFINMLVCMLFEFLCVFLCICNFVCMYIIPKQNSVMALPPFNPQWPHYMWWKISKTKSCWNCIRHSNIDMNVKVVLGKCLLNTYFTFCIELKLNSRKNVQL